MDAATSEKEKGGIDNLHNLPTSLLPCAALTNSAATKATKNALLAGAYNGGSILQRQAAASVGAKTVGRIGSLKAVLGVTSKFSGPVGLGATALSAAAMAQFFSDCRDECPDDMCPLNP